MTNQPANHQEAPASVSLKLYAESGADVMLTLRAGCTPAQAQELLDTLAGALTYAKDKYRLATVAPTAPRAADPAPAPAAVAGPLSLPAAGLPAAGLPAMPAPPVANGHQAAPVAVAPLTFEAQTLAVTIDETGKARFKIKGGGSFARYGLRVWPEVLAAAGFDVNALQAGQSYSLAGYSAAYILGDNGKPLKVTEILSS